MDVDDHFKARSNRTPYLKPLVRLDKNGESFRPLYVRRGDEFIVVEAGDGFGFVVREKRSARVWYWLPQKHVRYYKVFDPNAKPRKATRSKA